MTAPIRITRHTDADKPALRPSLVEVYAEIFTEPPYAQAADGAEEFAERLPAELAHPGCTLVTARQDDQIIGFTYGFPLAAGSRWWDNVVPPVDEAASRESGTRTFAIIELHVRRPWRRTGIATALHQKLLSGRPEERVTLGVRENAATAQRVYHQWGYSALGREEVHPRAWFIVLLRNLPLDTSP